MAELFKYPRTPHLEGSRLQPGDEDLEGESLELWQGRKVVIEEKLDGANCALSFDEDGQLWLQSRGHFLSGGPRERQFDLFKSWAHQHRRDLWEVLGHRYQVFGEWLYAKHTMSYDQLPDYFLEFDCWDRELGQFLDTPSRRTLLPNFVHSVPVLYSGPMPAAVHPWLGPSCYRSANWRQALPEDPLVLSQTDPSPLAEGLYLKWEENGQVKARAKWVRASFHQAVEQSGSHWADRPIVRNCLKLD
jgi:hypothetical protein